MGIAFVNSIEGTIFNMKKRNLNTNYIKVLNKTADLVATVLYYAPKQYWMILHQFTNKSVNFKFIVYFNKKC